MCRPRSPADRRSPSSSSSSCRETAGHQSQQRRRRPAQFGCGGSGARGHSVGAAKGQWCVPLCCTHPTGWDGRARIFFREFQYVLVVTQGEIQLAGTQVGPGECIQTRERLGMVGPALSLDKRECLRETTWRTSRRVPPAPPVPSRLAQVVPSPTFASSPLLLASKIIVLLLVEP